MKMRVRFFIITHMVMGASWPVFAHGVITDVRFTAPAVVINSSYSSTEMVSGAMVSVFSPHSEETPWQTGVTSSSGSFAFIPDTSGEWIFAVDDRMGHSKRLIISVGEGFIVSGEKEDGFNRMSSGKGGVSGIVTGLSVIFGITGIFYGLRSGRAVKQD